MAAALRAGRSSISDRRRQIDSLPLVWSLSYFLGGFFSLSFLLGKKCGVLGQVSVSAPNVVLRRGRPDKADDLQAKGWLRAFRCACWVLPCGGFLTGSDGRSKEVSSTCGRRQDAKATTREPSVPFARMGKWESEKSVSNKKGRRVGCIVSIYGAWVTGLLGL